MTIEREITLDNPKFEYGREELLLGIADAVNAFKKKENKKEWQAIAIDTATITRYLAYGQLESFLGASQHDGWVNLYNRVNYYMGKLFEKKNSKWILYRDYTQKLLKSCDEITEDQNKENKPKETKIKPNSASRKEEYPKSSKLEENMTEDDLESDFLVVNYNDFIREKLIYVCEHCEETFQEKEEIIHHLSKHSLELFIPDK